MNEQRWIIHLPTSLTSHEAAIELAATLERSLGHVSVIDFRETTMSEEGRQYLRHRLHCYLLDKHGPGGRCVLAGGHDGACQAGPATGSTSAEIPGPPTC